MGQHYLSRREFIAAGGAAFAAATGLTIDQAMAQKGFRLRGKRAGGGGGATGVLSPSDLNWLGYVRTGPTNQVGLLSGNFSGAGWAMRTVAGQKRLFTWGDTSDNGTGYFEWQLIEIALPTTAPTTDISASPQCSIVRNWGHATSGKLITMGGVCDIDHTGNGATLGGMLWDESRNALWWTYGDIYGVGGVIYPSLCCTVLNDTDGTFVTYGPWTVQKPTLHCARGSITALPASFASVYAPGCDAIIMGAMGSGITECPFGLDARAFALFDPTTKAPNVQGDSYSVPTVELINHVYSETSGIDHRQARDTRYKNCAWESASICGTAPITDGVPVWGGSDPAGGEADTINGAVWIDGSKRGLLYTGRLVRTPTGYTAPGDPDGYVHRWYGDAFYVDSHPTENAGHQNHYCCHGQPSIDWGTNGPGYHFSQPLGWIVDPNELGPVTQGLVNPWEVPIAHDAFEWKTYCAGLDVQPPTSASYVMQGQFAMNIVHDTDANRLYIPSVLDDITNSNGYARAALLVFEIV